MAPFLVGWGTMKRFIVWGLFLICSQQGVDLHAASAKPRSSWLKRWKKPLIIAGTSVTAGMLFYALLKAGKRPVALAPARVESSSVDSLQHTSLAVEPVTAGLVTPELPLLAAVSGSQNPISPPEPVLSIEVVAAEEKPVAILSRHERPIACGAGRDDFDDGAGESKEHERRDYPVVPIVADAQANSGMAEPASDPDRVLKIPDTLPDAVAVHGSRVPALLFFHEMKAWLFENSNLQLAEKQAKGFFDPEALRVAYEPHKEALLQLRDEHFNTPGAWSAFLSDASEQQAMFEELFRAPDRKSKEKLHALLVYSAIAPEAVHISDAALQAFVAVTGEPSEEDKTVGQIVAQAFSVQNDYGPAMLSAAQLFVSDPSKLESCYANEGGSVGADSLSSLRNGAFDDKHMPYSLRYEALTLYYQQVVGGWWATLRENFPELENNCVAFPSIEAADKVYQSLQGEYDDLPMATARGILRSHLRLIAENPLKLIENNAAFLLQYTGTKASFDDACIAYRDYLGGMSERACVGAGEVTSFVKSALYLVDELRGAYVSSRSRSPISYFLYQLFFDGQLLKEHEAHLRDLEQRVHQAAFEKRLLVTALRGMRLENLFKIYNIDNDEIGRLKLNPLDCAFATEQCKKVLPQELQRLLAKRQKLLGSCSRLFSNQTDLKRHIDSAWRSVQHNCRGPEWAKTEYKILELLCTLARGDASKELLMHSCAQVAQYLRLLGFGGDLLRGLLLPEAEKQPSAFTLWFPKKTLKQVREITIPILREHAAKLGAAALFSGEASSLRLYRNIAAALNVLIKRFNASSVASDPEAAARLKADMMALGIIAFGY